MMSSGFRRLLRDAVLPLTAAFATVAVAVIVNLLTPFAPSSAIYKWRFPLVAVAVLLVSVPILLDTRRRRNADDKAMVRSLAAASHGDGHLDLFAVSDGRLFHATYRYPGNDLVWRRLEIRERVREVAAVTPTQDLLECFVICEDGYIRTSRLTLAKWSRWDRLGKPLGRPALKIAAISNGEDHRELFVVTATRLLAKMSQERGAPWGGWEQMWPGSECRDVAASVKPQSGEIDCYAITADGRVQQTWYRHPAWADWSDWGEPPGRSAALAAAATTSGKLGHQELFVVNADGALGCRWYWDKRWSDWSEFDGPDCAVKVISAGTSSAGQEHCLVVDREGVLMVRTRNDREHWGAWQPLPTPE